MKYNREGDPALKRTGVRYYAFGGSVKPSEAVGFSALPLGRFTTEKRESQDPRDL